MIVNDSTKQCRKASLIQVFLILPVIAPKPIQIFHCERVWVFMFSVCHFHTVYHEAFEKNSARVEMSGNKTIFFAFNLGPFGG